MIHRYNNSEFDFKKSAIIEPPDNEKRKETRFTYVIVDSRDRDYDIYKSSSKYTIEFDDPHRDVVSVELVSARIPLSTFNVDDYNSSFVLNSGGNTLEVKLPQGYYSPDDVVDIVSQIITPHGYTLLYDPISMKFEFTNSTDFTIDFSSPFACPILMGFKKTQEFYSVNNKIVAPYPAVTDAISQNYALMIVDNFNNLKSTNNATNNAFALIDREVCLGSGENKPIAKKYFNPPLNEISRLNIKFMDYMNRPYEFSEKNHYFMLKIESLKSARLY